MSKFKIGDKIRVVKNTSNNKGKDSLIGKEFTIINEQGLSIGGHGMKYGIGNLYIVREDEIELAVNTYELHITCNDGKTTNAVYKVNGEITQRKQAKCSPSDTFDFAIGAQEALDRVFPEVDTTQTAQAEKIESKYKSGDKVKIIGNHNMHCYKIGEIVTLEGKRLYRDSVDLYYWDTGKSCGYVREQDIEPYAEPEQPSLTVTREMLVKLGACSGGLAEFDKKFPSGKGEFEEVCKATDVSNSCWLNNHRFSISTMQNEQPKEAVKLYCVKDYVNWNKVKWLTEGKLYTFENGSTTFDDGNETIKYGSFEEFARYNKNMAACLIRAEKRPAKVGECVIATTSSGHNAALDVPFKVTRVSEVCKNWVEVEIESSFKDLLTDKQYLVLDNYHPEPEKEPEPVYFSGEAIAKRGEEGITKGKKYIFKNGYMTDNDGERRPLRIYPIKSISDEWFENKFIPYLGEA